MYLMLFHGRENPDQDMDDWRFNGPIIGDVNISWTYHTIKIHDPRDGDFFFLPIHDDMVVLNGKYYGDFEVVERSDFKKNFQDQVSRVISYRTAKDLVTKQQTNTKICQPQQQ